MEGSEISFTEYMSNREFYKEKLANEMDFMLKRAKALKHSNNLWIGKVNSASDFNEKYL